jgi:hypothetical protein
MCTNEWVATAQVLAEAITSKANRLLSLDLSSLRDRSQLPGRAAITNPGQVSTPGIYTGFGMWGCTGKDGGASRSRGEV